MVENAIMNLAGRAMNAVCKWRGGGRASVPMPVTSPVGDGIYELLADWDVSGMLPDGRTFRVSILGGLAASGGGAIVLKLLERARL